MPSGLSPFWLLTWSLWSVVVYLDRRREPRDWRWVISLVAMVAVAVITFDSMREANLRFALLSGLAAAVILAWGVRSIRAQHRANETGAWAEAHEFSALSLQPQPAEATLPDDLKRLPIFSRGSLARTEGLVERREPHGGRVLVFRHAVRRQMALHGPSGIEAYGTAVAIYRPESALPLFAVRPEGLFPWFDGGPIGERVAVQPHSRFAAAYSLFGDEPRNLRALFSDSITTAISEKPGWIIQGEGAWVVALYFDRSENLMSLKTSSLRVVRPVKLAEHVGLSLSLLNQIAMAASRPMRRDAEVA